MTFQIKNFVSISAAMINHMRATNNVITDFNVGAVGRTMIEAPAIELDELYQQMFTGLMDAIEVATYNSFNFSLLPSQAASGPIGVVIAAQSTDTLIPAGTVCSSAGAQTTYVTLSDVTISAGQTQGNVAVSASEAGALGNLAAGASFTLSPAPAGFVSASNPATFSNGEDAETPDQRKRRFMSYVSTLARGTLAAIAYGAKTTQLVSATGVVTERVRLCSIVEPYLTDPTQPIALILVYVHNGVGGTSAALVSQADAVLRGYTDATGAKIPGWKAAGVKMVTSAATEVALNLTGAVTVAAGYDSGVVLTAVRAALTAYILGLDIGQPFLYSEAVFLVMSITGVANFVVSAPTADQTVTGAQKFLPGTLTLTAA